MLLRIDDIVSGIKKDRRAQAGRAGGEEEGNQEETFGDQRDG
jgi:hypothetical protein